MHYVALRVHTRITSCHTQNTRYLASIYADVMATCGSGGECYVLNDGIEPFTGTVTISNVNLANGKATVAKSLPVKLAAGAGTIEYFTIPPPPPAPTPPTPAPAGDCEFKFDLDWSVLNFVSGCAS